MNADSSPQAISSDVTLPPGFVLASPPPQASESSVQPPATDSAVMPPPGFSLVDASSAAPKPSNLRGGTVTYQADDGSIKTGTIDSPMGAKGAGGYWLSDGSGIGAANVRGVALAKEPETPPQKPTKTNGVLANIGAGTSDIVADAAGLLDIPGDVTRWAINKATGANIQPGASFKTGAQNLMGLIGADPRDVPTTSGPENVARTVGAGMGSMLLPAVGADAILARGAESLSPMAQTILESLRGASEAPESGVDRAALYAKNAVIGGTSGAGQYVGETVAPDGFGPIGGLFGSLIGGTAASLGDAAFKSALNRKSIETEAANKLSARITDLPAVKDALYAGAPDVVPGLQPTTGQLTNDPDILQMENWARTKDQAPFNKIYAGNNAAVSDTLGAVAGQQNPISAGEYFRNQLAELDKAHQAVTDAAEAHAQETFGNTAPTQTPEQAGATAQEAIQQRYAPRLAENSADQTVAEMNMQRALDQAGGNPQLGPTADTPEQHYGQQIDQFVQGSKDARDAMESNLWTVARQNGDLRFPSEPTQAAVSDAQSMVNTDAGDNLTPAEQNLYGTISGWSGHTVDFDTLKALRSNVGDAANTAFRSGDRRAGSRLLRVRNGIDASIERAVDTRDSAEQTAVKAGTLDPQDTIQSNLQRARDEWLADKKSGKSASTAMENRGRGSVASDADRKSAVPSTAGTTPEAATGPGEPGYAGGDQGLAPPLQEVAPGTTAERYATARAFTRETHGIYDDTPAGRVIARGPYGAPDKLPDSLKAAQFWNSKPTQVDAVRNFQAATNGNPDALAALHDYAAFDLKKAAVDPTTGRLDPVAYNKWMKAHDKNLSVFPELRQRFENIRSAQAELDGIADQRKQITDAFQKALGPSDSTVMPKYFKAGTSGADSMDRYTEETGNSPAAQQAMADHIAANMRADAAPNGTTLNPQKYAAWLKKYGPALSRRPELKALFDTAAEAQQSMDSALAKKKATIDAYQNSAAGHWLNSDPLTAVTNALSKKAGNDPVGNIDHIMKMTSGDPDAQEGIRSALRDWLVKKGVSGKEAGNTGTNYVKIQTMQDLIKDNRDALSRAFSPADMDRLDRIAASLKMTDRSISGSKAPIGPGSARDITAQTNSGAAKETVLGAIRTLAIRGAAGALGAAIGGTEGAYVGIEASKELKPFFDNIRSIREKKMEALIVQAIKDPESMRVLLKSATPENVRTASQRLAQRAAQMTNASALAAMSRANKQNLAQ